MIMIEAKIIKDSINNNNRITTWELEYPRYIHSELMTHRLFSRNSASSRAIPLKMMINLIWNNPAKPEHWGKNQSGMQAKEELRGWKKSIAEFLWNTTGKFCCCVVWALDKVGLHKQVANRILEPWAHMKVVMTATEMENWFNLRNHKDAQPEIKILAEKMWLLYNESTPKYLGYDDWHLPYVDGYDIHPDEDFVPFKNTDISLSDAIKLSASLCAQVSYRKSDQSVDKALRIYDRLVESKPAHLSPFEHQATPIKNNNYVNLGETHTDYKGNRWSGNFKGWIQYRQTLYKDLKLEPMTCNTK